MSSEDQKREITALKGEREKAAATAAHLFPERDETGTERNPENVERENTLMVVIPKKCEYVKSRSSFISATDHVEKDNFLAAEARPRSRK